MCQSMHKKEKNEERRRESVTNFLGMNCLWANVSIHGQSIMDNIQQKLIIGPDSSCRSRISSFLLIVSQRFPALSDFSSWRVNVVVMDNGLARSRARRIAVVTVRHHHDGVIVEHIYMAIALLANTESTTVVGVDVVVMVVVVAVKVILHSTGAVDEGVVVCLVVRRAIIVVNCHGAVVVGYDVIIRNLIILFKGCRLSLIFKFEKEYLPTIGIDKLITALQCVHCEKDSKKPQTF